METKMKKTGFTLIELLVVIVIIGILSTISTATFKSYFGKARDAERVSSVQSIALMMKVESSDAWDDSEKYLMGTSTDATFGQELISLFAANDFRVPKASKNIFYYIAASNCDDGNNGSSGDNNEFVVVTWGETKSTADDKASGIIVDGTEKVVAKLLASESGFVEADFRDATFATGGSGTVQAALDATVTVPTNASSVTSFGNASATRVYNYITTTGTLASS